VRKQKGLSLVGLIFVLAIIFGLSLLAFKVAPALIEYRTIERQMQSIAQDQTLKGASRGQLDRAWAMRASVENIKSIDGTQIYYEKGSDGGVVVTGEYSVKVPLFMNVSLWFDFKPSSQ
jgi:type II secretory pathway pseudopilin PulG